jgi:D-alanine-D-alanine ligase
VEKERIVKSSKPTVLVLMGGPDAEREVSIMSGTQVARALRDWGKFKVIDQTIDKPTLLEFKALVSGRSADVIFPVLHGHWGEGGSLQEMLDAVGSPYVGAKPQAAALAMDKLKTKAIVQPVGVPTPPAQELKSINDHCTIAPPLVIKPVDDGSSVDLRICLRTEDVDRARQQLHPKRGRLMAEQYIQGREITAGIVCDRSLPLIEIIPSKQVEFYDYEAKYTRDDTEYVIDPPLPPGVAEQCVQMAQTAYTRLGCRDVARVDIMLDAEGKPWFLEINAMPGFTTHSLVPMAARKIGLEMPALCAMLVEAALNRAKSASTSDKTSTRAKPQAAHA